MSIRPSTRHIEVLLPQGTAAQTITLGQAVETSTAQAVAISKIFVLGRAAETDTALALSAAKTVHLGQAAESDTASAVTHLKRTVLGLVTEEEMSQAVLSAGGAVGQNRDRLLIHAGS